MANKLTRALDKLQNHIDTHLLEDGEIGDGTYWRPIKLVSLGVKAVEVDGRVSTTSQRFMFLLNKQTFDELNLPIQRGLVIRYNNNDYEVVRNNNGTYVYNDQHSRNYIVHTTKLEADARD